MKIVCVVFDFHGDNKYHRLYDVFKRSCEKVMPHIKFEGIQMKPPTIKPGYSQGQNANVAKMRVWAQIMENAKEMVCFADCDMLALKTIEDIEKIDFDVAYTCRKHSSIPVNGGIMFVRPTERGKAFMRLLNAVDDKMYCDKVLHQRWRSKYAGINQAAFGYVLEKHSDVAKMVPISCEFWNSCCDTWREIGGQTRIVHVKGPLRKLLVGNAPIGSFSPWLREVAALWHAYEGRAEVNPDSFEFRRKTPRFTGFQLQRAKTPEAVPITPLDRAAGLNRAMRSRPSTSIGDMFGRRPRRKAI